MNCLFCKNPLDGSDEHIIPDSLNGRIHSKKIICYNCNSNVFGKKIDPVGKEFFDYLLLVFPIPKEAIMNTSRKKPSLLFMTR